MRLFLLLIFTFSINYISAQSWQDFVVEGKTYQEITSDIEQYFSRLDRQGKPRTGYKHYRRWQFTTRNHIDDRGHIVNRILSNSEVYDRAQKTVDANRAAHGNWENLGPFDYSVGDVFSSGGVGRVNCAAFHPSDSSIIWVGTAAGGLWKSTDTGITWTPLTDKFSSIGVSSIVVHPESPDTLFVLTGDGDGYQSRSIGVIKSYDGGQNWKTTGLKFNPNQNFRGFEMIGHPTSPDTMWAAYNYGIYTTTDGWNSFSQTDTSYVWDLEIKPSNPDSIFAACDTGLIVSADAGLTWSLLNDPIFPDTFLRFEIAISPSAPNSLYALFGGENSIDGDYRGLFKSTNAGSNFTMMSGTPNILGPSHNGGGNKDQADYDLCIEIDPENDAHVYVGGINHWRSLNNGITWDRRTWWTRNEEPVLPYVHADWHNMYFANGAFWSCNDGGFYKSLDKGGEWTELSGGLSNMQFYQIDILNNEYMGGTQDNGTNSADFTNPQCNNIAGGDGFGAVWHTGDNSIQFLSTQNSIIRRQLGSNINIWEEADGFWFTDIHMHETDPNYLFVIKDRALYRGNQNTSISDFNFFDLGTAAHFVDEDYSDEILGFSQCESIPDVMFVCNNLDIIKTTNLSAANPSWDSLGRPSNNAWVIDVLVDPNDSSHVWALGHGYIIGQKVYESLDGGNSWDNISGTLPNIPMRSIAHDTTGTDALYIGTEVGVYYRNSSMTDWSFFGNYLPNTAVTDLVISNGYLYAGTFGRGIWRSPLFSCEATENLTLANDPSPGSIGQREIQVSNTITSSRILSGVDVDVQYIAGDEVLMLPGFVADKDVKWVAKIGPCPN